MFLKDFFKVNFDNKSMKNYPAGNFFFRRTSGYDEKGRFNRETESYRQTSSGESRETVKDVPGLDTVQIL